MIKLVSLATAVLTLLSGLGQWLRGRRLRRQGRDEAALEASQQVIDDVKAARQARDALRDPAERRRVRERFTRRDP